MTEINSNIGVQSNSDNINWKYLNEDRVDDPIIMALIKESNSLYIKNEIKIEDEKIEPNILNIYISYFNKFLKDLKIKIEFSLHNEQETEDKNLKNKKDTKKIKKQEPTKKEAMLIKIKEDAIKKNMKDFIDTLVITNNTPTLNKKYIESFFVILYWSIYLINSKNSIDTQFYLNNAISLYRAINESDFLFEKFKLECLDILNKIQNIILSKNRDLNLFLNLLNDNLGLIIDSFWDKMKPKSVALYNEQKDIISLVINNLTKNILVFYEMPPANGKTILSAILAKIISHRNKVIYEKQKSHKRKTLLYICYNTIVRNEVAKLCITHGLDVKYWLAVTGQDKDDGKIKTFFRPYKNCYPDWNNNKRTKKEQEAYEASKWMRFSENIHDQWNFYINETRPMSEQNIEVGKYPNPSNIPEMIISDLDSAYTLLSNFPDTFITYFDEAFASANLEITAKIMSKLGHTVLVSATLSKPDEIPTVIDNFKTRHGWNNNSDFLYEIKSGKQHISCTMVDEEGFIFLPHQKNNTIDELRTFLPSLEQPLLRRAYSPEVVIIYSKIINNFLPEDLKFKNRFDYFGKINHESLREYLIEILNYICKNNNEVLFDKIKNIRENKIKNMDIKTMFTSSAYNYQLGKTMHVATTENFNLHVEELAQPLINGSPKLSDVITTYNREKTAVKNQLENLDKNGDRDSDFERSKLLKELDNIKLNWPQEYVINTMTHANKFGTLNYIKNSSKETLNITPDDVNIFNDTRGKLLLSGIGIYQPESFNTAEMTFFLRKKERFKIILSTPSIVYGTNISLTIIDIDSSFTIDSTKNTLYQLIGRAGRKGKSDSALIIFRNNQMIDMILENSNINIEAIMIENNIKKILNIL